MYSHFLHTCIQLYHRAADKKGLVRTKSKSNLTGYDEYNKRFEEFGDLPRVKHPIRNKMSSQSY